MPDRSSRSRILVLIKGLGIGGAERLLEAAIPHLDRDRFDYHVAYMLSWKDALVPAFEAAGIPVHRLDVRRSADPRVLIRLAAVMRREGFDLVHAHLPVTGFWARICARVARVRRVVYTEHNVPRRYHPVSRLLNRGTYSMNDVVIAVSDEVHNAVAGYARGRPAIVTIKNAVDIDGLRALQVDPLAVRREFGFPPEALLVTTVGNLTPKKGHGILLAAAARVLLRSPEARFVIVGQGPLAEALRQEADRLGLNGKVVFAGFRPDAVRVVAASDVFVLSSLFEGLPVSLLEAMALGKPSVVTRAGGIPEVVDDSTGIRVEPGDVPALAAGIVTLLEAPELRRRMGAAAQERARTRTGVAQMVRQIEQVYTDLLRDRPA